MPIQKYYPPLSDLVDAKALPGDFEALENLLNEGIDLILGKIFYKDFSVQVINSGETKFYSIKLLTKTIRLPLVADMNLVFFRNATGSLSEFPILFEWTWPISKYISNFETQGFSYAPEAFLDILIELSEIRDRKEFFNKIVTVFLNNGDDAYLSFFNDITASVNDYSNGNSTVSAELTIINNNLTIIKDEIETLLTATNLFTIHSIYENYEDNIILKPAVDAINDAIETLQKDFSISVDIFGDVLRTLLGSLSDLDEKFDRLLRLFRGWIADIDMEDIKSFLIPQFTIELKDINMALEFPRKWLVPALEVTPPGNYIEDPDLTKQAALEFTVGNLKFSTKKGFEFENQSSFTFERAYIGNTGIMLAFSDLKVDMSEAYNIPEADADGRPEDFQGVYAGSASITLPANWFKDPDGTNAEIFGKDLLIGTGGLSGIIGLNALGGDNMFWANIGSNDGFRVGFESFDIQFKQNKVLSSNIKGAMEIKKFVYPTGHPNAGDTVRIDIEGHIHDNGDFNLTASAQPPYPIELPNVFIYDIKSLELGREEDDFYIGTSGKLQFQGFLKDTLKLKEIEINRLRIYSDGSIEFEGGSIALVEPIVLALGPVEITVSAIHYGSHQKEVNGVMRKFNYFGFDGGISVDPLGIEIRGDGVKFYYCTDDLPNKPDSYLHIQTLHLDLTIPSKTPVAIINGWLSIPEPGTSKEYAGGIKLQLPQAKIAGSADMKLMPRYPAFIIDASIDLPAPIPLGPVGIYGFRGLIGYRYVAEKEAAGLTSGVDTWYDYYKVPPRGIHVSKFNGPDRTTVAGTPFSIGAGASLGTSFDNGTVLNIKAMVLLSIPSLFMIDGRAAILSARLGLDDSGDPPFFAFIAVGDNSLELGFGADFKMPSSNGKILTLYADIQAGFFFNDSSKWYVNIGTKTNPVTARVLTLMTITSYVMLSAKGIEAGARGEFNFYRKYGPIKVHAWAYIEVGGKISFEKPQFGAYLAAGVGADIDIKIVSLYAAFDILFGVEAPKPFLIYGEFRYCVKIKIAWIFKFKFCGKLAVSWEFNSTVDRSPINPMINPANAGTIGDIVQGVNMLSNETFQLAYMPAGIPTNLPNSIKNKIIPLDTYIDIKTEKGLLPKTAVTDVIGGYNNPAQRYTEKVPPQKIIKGKEVRQVTHEYSIESLVVKSWNPDTSTWDDYDPYKALYPDDQALDNLGLKIGQFQKLDGQYSTIRLLATTPFSYTEQGEPGWYIPEQYGITPGSLFCEGEEIKEECANFLEKPLGHQYFCYDENHMFYANEAAFFLYNKTDEEFGVITNENSPFPFAQSLQFENTNILQIRLPEPSFEASLKLTSFSSSVKIRYYASLIDDTTSHVQYGHPDPTAADPSLPYEITKNSTDLNVPVTYSKPNWLPITRIEIVPQYPNSAEIEALQEQIALIIHTNNLIELGLEEGEIQSTEELEARLERLKDIGCELYKAEGDEKVKEKAAVPEPTGKCDPKSLCELYNSVKEIEPCFIVDKVGDWSPQVNCAEQLLNTIYVFDRANPDCLIVKNFGQLIAYVEEFMGAPGYDTLEPMRAEITKLLNYLNEQGDCANGECEKDEKVCALYDSLLYKYTTCFPDDVPDSKGEYFCAQDMLELINTFNENNPEYELRSILEEEIASISDYIESGTPQSEQFEWTRASIRTILAYLLNLGQCDCEPHCGDKVICDLWEQIFNIRNNCLPHPQQINLKQLEVYRRCYQEIVDLLRTITDKVLWAQVSNKLKPVFTFIARPITDNYGEAWTAVQCILDVLWEAGNCDCETDNRKCYTLLHEVCWMSVESYQFNINIPGQAAIEADALAAVAGITQYIQPVWRPNTNFVINFVLRDMVDNNQADATEYPFTYGFSTAGPVGYFHEHPKSTYGEYQEGGSTVEDAVINPDKYALTSLKRYIDYKRSYPNADGNLLSAKPLFYNDETTRIDLYFAKAYATHFFHEWGDYNGNDIVKGRIKIVIKDPREDGSIENPPYLDYDPADTIHTNIPQTIESWEDDPNPQIPHIFDQYAGLMAENDCVATGGDRIVPKSSYLTVIPKHLKPLKLYTAIVNNLFDLDGNLEIADASGQLINPEESKEVHKFTFQTSRYASFKDQVNSYILSDNDPVSPTTREAVFSIFEALTPAELQAAFDTIEGNPNALSDGLTASYQHPYDRVVEGLLGFKPIDPAISTEFNLVKNTSDSDQFVALIIRNPEPFNNPKLPLDEVEDTIQVLLGNGAQDTSYKVLYSKDYSQAIIMRSNLTLTAGLFDFKFTYKIWNGIEYIIPALPDYSTDEAGTIVINDLQLV